MRTHFYLREPKAKSETPIHFFFSYGGKRLVYPIGFKILPAKWDFDKERPVRNAKDAGMIEQEMQRVKSAALEALKRLTDNNHNTNRLKSISVKQLRQALKVRLEGEPSPEQSLLSFVQDELKARVIQPKISDNTIQNYRNLLHQLEGFKADRRASMDFDDIDFTWFEGFRDYLHGQNLVEIYISNLLQNLKMFIRLAKQRKIHHNSEALEIKVRSDLGIQPERSKEIALTLEQIKELIEIPIDNRTKRMAKDLLIVSCLTGLRKSDWEKLDLGKLKVNHINGFDFVEIFNQKTKTECFIPLLYPVKDVLNEYAGRLPKLSYNTFKDYAREVGKDLGYTDTFTKTVIRGGKKEIEVSPEYELIKGHTGRRTWNSICRALEVPDYLIKMVTGHKDSNSMTDHYDHRTKEQKAEQLTKYLVKIEKILQGDGAKEIAI